MSDEKKRLFSTRDGQVQKNKTQNKRQRGPERDVEPPTPPLQPPILQPLLQPPLQPPLQLPPRAPDTASFLTQISQSSHPPSTYSAAISDRFQKLKQPWDPKSDANPTRPGHLSSQDYEEGYISDEGDKFLKAVHARKDVEIQNISELGGGKKSRSNNQIKEGTPTSVQYHGVKIDYRIDFTEIEEKSTEKKPRKKKNTDEQAQEEIPAPNKVWVPHARIFVGSQNLSTVKLAKLAEDIHGHEDDTLKQQYLSGIKGQASPTEEKSAAYAIGVESRAVGRASDAFGHVLPALDGYLLSKPQSSHEASLLFNNPQFGTGALGSQNSGPTATPDFHAFNEIASDTRKQHSTMIGTTLNEVPTIRKANAINVFAPEGEPVVVINTGRK